jgi:hypothetical protein
MEYVVPLALAFLVSILVIWLISNKGKVSLNSIRFSQSELHGLVKNYIVTEVEEKTSQLQKHLSKNAIRIMTVDDSAYWIANNIFYMAELKNGMPDFNNAVPVDTINMSKTDLDKMMFILDNLRRGIKDDSDSSRNE